MNQILYINDTTKAPKKIEVKKIIFFFAVCLVLLGVVLVINFSYAIYKKGKEEKELIASIPTINITQISEALINVVARDDKEIKQLAYHWNNDQEVIITGNGTKEISQDISIISGTNTLYIRTTDIDNKQTTYENIYTLETEKPVLNLEAVEEGVKIDISSEIGIAYLTYRWDEQEEQKIDINAKEYTTNVKVPSGQHKLTVVGVDSQNQTIMKEKTVIGDKEPTLVVTVKDNDKYVINAEDDEGLTKVTFTLNDMQLPDMNLDNKKEFETEIPLTTGENKLIVTVYNVNGLMKQSKVMCRFNM